MTKLAKSLLTALLTGVAFSALVTSSMAGSHSASETEAAAESKETPKQEATDPVAKPPQEATPDPVAKLTREATPEVAAKAKAEEIKPPKDAVAKAAFDVLDKHCARCHQTGKLGKREKVASNFGNVLKLHELATDSRFVLPGNPDASELIKRTADPVRADMPYDVRNAELTGEDSGFPSPTTDEIAALRNWVKSLGEQVASACKPENFMNRETIVKTIADDLNSLQDHS